MQDTQRMLLLLHSDSFSRVPALLLTWPPAAPHSWDSQAKTTGVGCSFLLMKSESPSKVAGIHSSKLLATPYGLQPTGSLRSWDSLQAGMQVGR